MITPSLSFKLRPSKPSGTSRLPQNPPFLAWNPAIFSMKPRHFGLSFGLCVPQEIISTPGIDGVFVGPGDLGLRLKFSEAVRISYNILMFPKMANGIFSAHFWWNLGDFSVVFRWFWRYFGRLWGSLFCSDLDPGQAWGRETHRAEGEFHAENDGFSTINDAETMDFIPEMMDFIP